MTIKFRGTLDNLKQHLSKNGFNPIKEEIDGSNKICLRFQDGSIINFWPSTGTINIQGKPNEALSKMINELCDSNTSSISSIS